MTSLLLALLLAAPPKADAPRAAPVVLPASPAAAPVLHREGTPCAACHVATSWTKVRFNHERTGFVLEGGHARASCKGCHVKDFATPLSRTCGGCHADVHAGELGVRCEGCHDSTDWRSRFEVDAHRRTNFPLLGAHAMVPCVECHLEARERRFSRQAVECQGCHQGAVVRTVGTAVDHSAPDRSWDQRNCRECHSGVSFRPASFPEHEQYFRIASGAHAGIACAGCHASLAGGSVAASIVCTECHEHACSNAGGATETDRIHEGVPGYQCQSRKCAECHSAGGAQP